MKSIFKNTRNILLAGAISLLIFGCSSKETGPKEYNKPAVYWYNEMLKEIAYNDLEAADDTFISLDSEHRNSPLIPAAMYILANAHMAEEEYELAKYYLDEYMKRFRNQRDIEYIRYLKIKANFYAFHREFRDQLLVEATIEETEDFIKKYPKSPYIQLVRDIYSRMKMAKASFDYEISALYGRIDKPVAQEFYAQKSEKSWKYPNDVKAVRAPFYIRIFE